MRRPSSRVTCLLLLAIAVMAYLPGINWGLPSRDADHFLFGDRAAWTGKQIIELAGGWETRADTGADVALNPLARRDGVVLLNGTDAQRAEIVRRYRLFSYQPDEMVTLRALAGMKPRQLQLDPRLYQYGGLWVYPVGALLGLASRLHVVTLNGDLAYYLDHPEQFGRFYIVARYYTFLWALVGVLAVHTIVKRICAGGLLPFLAASCFIFMPVVMNMAHEAKPHLPGAVLMLLAAIAGSKYVETGRNRWWLAAGAGCGAAVGMVLSSLSIFIILPAMIALRASQFRDNGSSHPGPALHHHFWRVGVWSVLVGLIVYFLANPYVAINLVHNRAVLRSNLGNTGAMFQSRLSLSGVLNGLKLMAVGTSPILAVAGALGAVGLVARAIRKRNDSSPEEIRRRSIGLLLALPALWVAGQCIAFAGAQPAEFGRFAIFTDVFLLVEAYAAIGTFLPKCRWTSALAVALTLTTLVAGLLYWTAFVRDSGGATGRLDLARRLADMNSDGDSSMALFAEPAPYCLPPVDLWKWKLLLLPAHSTLDQGLSAADVAVKTSDVPVNLNGWRGWVFGTPISWASKPFAIEHWQDRAYHSRDSTAAAGT